MSIINGLRKTIDNYINGDVPKDDVEKILKFIELVSPETFESEEYMDLMYEYYREIERREAIKIKEEKRILRNRENYPDIRKTRRVIGNKTIYKVGNFKLNTLEKQIRIITTRYIKRERNAGRRMMKRDVIGIRIPIISYKEGVRNYMTYVTVSFQISDKIKVITKELKTKVRTHFLRMRKRYKIEGYEMGESMTIIFVKTYDGGSNNRKVLKCIRMHGKHPENFFIPQNLDNNCFFRVLEKVNRAHKKRNKYSFSPKRIIRLRKRFGLNKAEKVPFDIGKKIIIYLQDYLPKQLEMTMDIHDWEGYKIYLVKGHYILNKWTISTQVGAGLRHIEKYYISYFDIETETKSQVFETDEGVERSVHTQQMFGYTYHDQRSGMQYSRDTNYKKLFRTLLKNIDNLDYTISSNIGLTKERIEELRETPELGLTIIIQAFNGANFDFLSLLSWLLEQDPKDLKIENLAMKGPTVVMFDFKYKGQKFKFHDICRLREGTYKDNMEGLYHSDPEKYPILKGDIDYSKFDKLENMSQKDIDEEDRYLKSDVIGMKAIYETTKDFYINTLKIPDPIHFVSTSQATMYCYINNYLKKEKYKIYNFDNKEHADFARSCAYAGRTAVTKRKFKSEALEGLEDLIDMDMINEQGSGLLEEHDREKAELWKSYYDKYDTKLLAQLAWKRERPRTWLEQELEKENLWDSSKYDHLRDMDVTSLYPAVMAILEFPVGHYSYKTGLTQKESDKYLEGILNKEIMACVRCDVVCPQDLIHAPIGQRGEKDELEWTLETKVGQYYDSYSIQAAIRQGCEIRINRIMYWHEKAKIFEEYIKMLFAIKKSSRKGSPEYLIAKLFMNGLYGKMLQKPITKKTVICANTEEDQQKLYEHMKNGEITFFTEVNENYIVYEWDDSKRVSRDSAGKLLFDMEGNVEYLTKTNFMDYYNKPYHLGSFILGGTRLLMNEMENAIGGFREFDSSSVYEDTDSKIIHVREVKKIIDQISSFTGLPFISETKGGSELGQFCDDLGENCRIIHYIGIRPKMYCVTYITKDGEICTVLKGAGVPKHILKRSMYTDQYQGLNVETGEYENAFLKNGFNPKGTQKQLPFLCVYKEKCSKTLQPIYKGKTFLEELDGFLPHKDYVDDSIDEYL